MELLSSWNDLSNCQPHVDIYTKCSLCWIDAILKQKWAQLCAQTYIPISILGSKVWSYSLIIWKKVWKYTKWVSRYKAKSLNREIRSQWPISILGSKAWSFSLIIWKKYENILIECQDIRQNHWTVKLGHSDLGLLHGQMSCHTQTYFERSLYINHLSTEI